MGSTASRTSCSPSASHCSLSSIKAVHWLRWDCFSSGCLPAGYPLSAMLPSVCKTLHLPVHLMNIVLTASLPIMLLLCSWKAGQFKQCDNLFIYSNPLSPFVSIFPLFLINNWVSRSFLHVFSVCRWCCWKPDLKASPLQPFVACGWIVWRTFVFVTVDAGVGSCALTQRTIESTRP